MNDNNQKFPKGVEIVGSAIIENDQGEILLVRAPKWHNKWTMPGGHIEPGEKIAQALLREAAEETGLQLKAGPVIAFGELINSKDFHRPAHFIYFDLVCKVKSGVVTLDNQELTEHIWIDPEKALTMELAESYYETIQNYLKYKQTGKIVL